jgi:PmbA protein
MSESTARPPGGKVPVLFGPRVVSSLIRAIGMGLSGRRVAKGESPLEGKLSQPIAHESLTLIDDPLTDFAVGAREIDDCGVPARRMALIEEGILKSYLYDWDSAHLAGAEPTGHTSCALAGATLEGGRHEQQELISAMGDGLFVRSLAGFGQGNIINGDFAANVALGWRVENGRLTGRVKDTMISGNLYQILRNPILMARQVDPVYRMPAALLEDVTVSARS